MEYSLTGPPGQPVIAFVHGFSMNLRQFSEQERYFSDKHRVLLFSLRGHGDSSYPQPADRQTFSLEVMAEDAVSLIDHLGLTGVHWVGNSMGGLLGYQMLREAPEKLLSLATFGITGRQNYSPFFEKIGVLSLNLMISLNLIPVLSKLAGSMVSKIPEVRERILKMAQEASKPALKNGHYNVYNFNYLDDLAEAELPILLIRCQHDKAMNRVLGATLQVLESSEWGRVVEMENVGHFANLEDPVNFNRILENWYQEIM